MSPDPEVGGHKNAEITIYSLVQMVNHRDHMNLPLILLNLRPDNGNKKDQALRL